MLSMHYTLTPYTSVNMKTYVTYLCHMELNQVEVMWIDTADEACQYRIDGGTCIVVNLQYVREKDKFSYSVGGL